MTLIFLLEQVKIDRELTTSTQLILKYWISTSIYLGNRSTNQFWLIAIFEKMQLDPVNLYVSYPPGCLKEQEFVINNMGCSWKVCHESGRSPGNLSSFFFSHTVRSVLTQNTNPNETAKSRMKGKIRIKRSESL